MSNNLSYCGLKENTDIHLSAYYFRSNMRSSTPMHSHNRIEFMYILEGQCSVQTQNETYILSKGQIIFIDANVEHNLLIHEQNICRILNLEFTFKPHKGILPSFSDFVSNDEKINSWITSDLPVIVLSDSGILIDVMKKIVITEKNNTPLKLQLLIYQFLLDYSELFCDSVNRISKSYIEKTINYLYTHSDQPVKVNDIAATVHLHPNYLQRTFKKEMKVTLIEYLHQIRLNRAAKLLKTTDYSIMEISEFVGYSSRQHFTAKFSNAFGLSPAQFRKKNIDWHLLDNE